MNYRTWPRPAGWALTTFALLSLIFLIVAFATPLSAQVQHDAETRKAIDDLVRASKARAAIVKQASNAVVHISVEKTVKDNGPSSNLPDFFDDEFFRRFFAPRLPVPPREFKQRGLGSGAIVDKRG